MNSARVRFARAVIRHVIFQSYRRTFFAEFGVVFFAFSINQQSRVLGIFGGHIVKKKRRVIIFSRHKSDNVALLAFKNFCYIIGFLVAVEIARHNTFSVAAIVWSRRYFPAAIIFVEIVFDFRRQNLCLREIRKLKIKTKIMAKSLTISNSSKCSHRPRQLIHDCEKRRW